MTSFAEAVTTEQRANAIAAQNRSLIVFFMGERMGLNLSDKFATV